jgi:hypothetical protein
MMSFVKNIVNNINNNINIIKNNNKIDYIIQ